MVMASLNSLKSNGVNNDSGTITTDNSGTMTMVKIAVTTGSVKRLARGSGGSTATITHNWGEQADIVMPYYNGNFGSPPTQSIAIKDETANAFTVVGQSGYAWTVLYIKF